MSCQRYQKWIEEAALGALEASRLDQLKAHLAACSQCHEAYEAEQRLLATIDQRIATSVEGAPSAQFATDVRTRLNRAPQERPRLTWERGHPGRIGATRGGQDARAPRWWRPAVWTPALGLAALAVVLLTLWLVRRAPRPRVPERARVTTPSPQAHQPPVPQRLARVGPPEAASRAVRRVRPSQPAIATARQARYAQSGGANQEPQLEVLVQPGQAEALAELYRTMQHGKDPIGDQSAQNGPVEVQAVEVKPIAIAELQPPKPINPAGDQGSTQ